MGLSLLILSMISSSLTSPSVPIPRFDENDVSRNVRRLNNPFGEDIEPGQQCGSEGFVLDAPVPEVIAMQRYLRHRSRKRRAATSSETSIWPKGIIPYEISKRHPASSARLIRSAMDHWENETCIRFIPRTTQKDYVYIWRGNGCCSHVGRRQGKQFLSLGLGCLRFGIIVHELGHVIGFWHEQNRPDRSVYVDVIYDNVDISKYLNFDLRSLNEVETFDQIYDYKSIMHYGAKFFSRNGYKTISAKGYKTVQDDNIGSSYYMTKGPVLSTQDIIETNLLYKCNYVTKCGGTIFSTEGSFTSIDFPKTYPQEPRDCIWIMTTTKEKKVSEASLYRVITIHLFCGFPDIYSYRRG